MGLRKTQCKLHLTDLVEDPKELKELQDIVAQLIELRRTFADRVSRAASKSAYLRALTSMGHITQRGSWAQCGLLSNAFQFDERMNITVDFVPDQLLADHPDQPPNPIDNSMLKTLLHTKLLSDEEKRELLVRNKILLKQSTSGESND